jgi:hypothetical protein
MSDGILFHTKGQPHTHSQKLEKWLGADNVASMSNSMKNFYHPIPVGGVPGTVWAMPGGDFVGQIDGGTEMSAIDRAMEKLRQWKRRAIARGGRVTHGQLNAFATLDALIAAVTGGKSQQLLFNKTGVAVAAIGNAAELWTRGTQPAAGAAGAAVPGGTITTNATTGNWGWANPANTNTGHFLAGEVTASVINNTLLVIDQMARFAVNPNSTATQAVTGVSARYQSGTATAADYIGGNFCFPANPTTVLAATAHNWTVCQYTDQGSAAANNFTSTAGLSACAVGAIDLAINNWFMPLATGDVGVKALTQVQLSAAVATGTIDWVLAHPIAFMSCPVANLVCIADALYTAMQLQSVFDNACITGIELPKPAVTATTYSGRLTLVAE